MSTVKRRRKRDPQEESSTSASKRQQTSKGKKALKGKQPEQPQVPGERPEPSEPPSNEEPEQPARRAFYTSSLQRKCKVSTLMNDGFEGYRGLFRTIAEEFSVVRRDALNFGLFLLVRWLNTQQLEIHQQYMEQLPNVSQQMRQLLHQGRLLEQLQGQLGQLNQDINAETELFAALVDDIPDLTAHQNDLNTAIDEIRPQIGNLRGLNERLTLAALGSQDRLQLGALQRDTAALIAELQGQLDHLTQIVGNMYETIRRLSATITPQQDAIYQGFSVNLQRYFEIDMEMEAIRRALTRAQTTLARAVAEQNTDVILRTRNDINIHQRRLAQLREEQAPRQAEVDNSQNAAVFVANQYVLNVLGQMESLEHNTILELLAMTAQLAVVNQAPQSNLIFPNIVDINFWRHAYRAVAGPNTRGYNGQARNMERCITNNIAAFDRHRCDETGARLYQLPGMDHMHASLAHNYAEAVVQNVVMHLLNVHLWFKRIFKAFIIVYKNANPNVRIAVKNTASTAANGIFKFRDFGQLELPNIPGLLDVYHDLQQMYNYEFLNVPEDTVKLYDNAKKHPIKYARLSFCLLQYATLHPDWNVKLWCLLPQASHGIVHAPLARSTAFYGLMRRAELLRLPIPLVSQDANGGLLPMKMFCQMYVDPRRKEALWHTLFDVDHLQRNRILEPQELNQNAEERAIKLGYGLKTDGVMVGVLFQRKTREFNTVSTGDFKYLARQRDLSNVSSGIYPLYKEPRGITMDDYIVGLDPGVRDVVVAVDCPAEDIGNRDDLRQHVVSVSNTSYKQRSGMAWINQRELQSRQHADIQPVYDQLASSNIPSNRGVADYLDSLYAQHERIFTFMCSYKHRENKAANYSNRNQANDFIARAVICRTNTDEPYKLAHTSTKRQRKKARKRFRRGPQRRQLRDQDDQQRTVVAYGDASIQATMKKHTPVPVKKVQKALSTKAIVIPTDEFRTSVFCSHCLRRNEQRFPVAPLICTHRKKIRRVPTGRIRQDGTQNTRAARFCLDDEGNFAHRTSQCPARARPQQVHPIYALRLCQQCPENNGQDIVWNRDANAGLNMRTILTRYIVSHYDLASRPLEISRARRRQEDDEA